MIWFVGTIHVIVCLILIGVVLLQQGKSADLAGAFGGQGSQTAFGPRGAANLLTKVTTWAAIVFMFTSIGLTVLIQRSSGSRSVLSGIQDYAYHPGQARGACQVNPREYIQACIKAERRGFSRWGALFEASAVLRPQSGPDPPIPMEC